MMGSGTGNFVVGVLIAGELAHARQAAYGLVILHSAFSASVTKTERHTFYIGAAGKLYKSLCAEGVDIWPEIEEFAIRRSAAYRAAPRPAKPSSS